MCFTGQHKRLISSPPVAIFPHPLASDLSFSRHDYISVLNLLGILTANLFKKNLNM
jgi:hypothetical protein